MNQNKQVERDKMNKNLINILDEIEKEKGIAKDILINAIESALSSAYRKNYGSNAGNLEIKMLKDTGEIKVYYRKLVVKDVVKETFEVSLNELADGGLKDYKIGDEILIETETRDFGRIAAQTAKQVIVQKLREAERNVIYDKYIDKERDIVTGTIQRIEHKNIIIDLGKTEALLLPNEQIRNEDYYKGKRIKIYLIEVRKTSKGPRIYVSRTHPELLKRLFELEVPEIHEGLVEIKSIAREAGKRSKVAVHSKDERIDPVGACIGDRGARIKSILYEINNEKIDIIKWSMDDKLFISNSLSPAKVLSVYLFEEKKMAAVIVPDQQLSLAIGKEGQNARLAAKLTGWKVDIKSQTQYDSEMGNEETGKENEKEKKNENPTDIEIEKTPDNELEVE